MLSLHHPHSRVQLARHTKAELIAAILAYWSPPHATPTTEALLKKRSKASLVGSAYSICQQYRNTESWS